MIHFSQLIIYDGEIDFASVAFIAVDEHGLGSAILLDIIGAEPISDLDETNGGLLVYF